MTQFNHVAGESAGLTGREKLEKLANRMGPLGQKLLTLNRNTLVMALAFVLGAGWALWKVRTVETFTPDQASETSLTLLDMGAVAVTVCTETPEQGPGSTAALVSDLAIRPADRQVRMPARGDRLFRFSLSDAAYAKPEPVTPTPAAVVATPVAQPEKVEKPPSLEGVGLDLVLIGSPSMALISGRRVTEGQQVFGWTVREIHPKRVVLQWKDRTAQLKMR